MFSYILGLLWSIIMILNLICMTMYALKPLYGVMQKVLQQFHPNTDFTNLIDHLQFIPCYWKLGRTSPISPSFLAFFDQP